MFHDSSDRFHLDATSRLLLNLENQIPVEVRTGRSMFEPQAGGPFGLDSAGLIPVGSPTDTDERENSPGNFPISQTVPAGEQSLSPIDMPNVYKQWAIGGIDAKLHVLWAASQAVDVPIPYEPYESPFVPPADDKDRSARIMGSFQLPALGAAAAELGFIENGGDVPENRATFGQAATNDYRSTFFAEHPELKGNVIVHHAVEQKNLTRYPGVASEAEIHSLENLRGIPKEINPDLHLRLIRREWDDFYEQNPNPSKQELLDKATEIDARFGSKFRPPRGGKK